MLTLSILPVYGLRIFGTLFASMSWSQFEQVQHEEPCSEIKEGLHHLQSEYSIVGTPILGHDSHLSSFQVLERVERFFRPPVLRSHNPLLLGLEQIVFSYISSLPSKVHLSIQSLRKNTPTINDHAAPRRPSRPISLSLKPPAFVVFDMSLFIFCQPFRTHNSHFFFSIVKGSHLYPPVLGFFNKSIMLSKSAYRHIFLTFLTMFLTSSPRTL